jgi:hypothetical protein
MKNMSEFKPRPPLTSESNSVTLAHSTQPPQDGIPSYSSMSYTVANAVPPTIEMNETTRETSKPLSAVAIRVVNSVLQAKVNESAIRRDQDEGF